MNNLHQYNKELQRKFLKTVNTKLDNNEFNTAQSNIIKKKKYKLEKDIIVLDSDDRDKNIYPKPNEYVLSLLEELKNVIAIRLLKSEYVLKDNAFNLLTINDQIFPIQAYKNVHAYIYLNGYNKIKMSNRITIPIFSQLSPGINNIPLSTDDFRIDPYVHRLNPVEKKLIKFDIKLLDNKGEIVEIIDPEKIQIILTLIVYRLL
jgi:hypothetical protein